MNSSKDSVVDHTSEFGLVKIIFYLLDDYIKNKKKQGGFKVEKKNVVGKNASKKQKGRGGGRGGGGQPRGNNQQSRNSNRSNNQVRVYRADRNRSVINAFGGNNVR